MALSEKQQLWILRHFKNTKNDEIMAKFNISHSSLHRFAREKSLKKTAKFQKQCQLNASREARKANKKNNWPPKGYIIPKSVENQFKKGITPAQRLGEKKNKQRILRLAESRRKTVESEKRRVLFGLEQKTKLKVIAAPSNKIAFKYTLKLRGYTCDRFSNTIFFDSSTNRSEKSEKTAKEKYFFRIEDSEKQLFTT